MKGFVLVPGMLLPLLSAAPAHATDFVSLRTGFTMASLPGNARYAASLGASFEANIIPDQIGIRLGSDGVFAGWSQAGSGHTLGLRPEIAFYPGPDGARFRLFGAVRWHIAAIGLGPAHAHLVEALELGPEFEWRDLGRTWLRFRLGTFLTAGRDPSGAWQWPGGGAVALTIEYGKPTLEAVEVPTTCVELPTRPCPKPLNQK